MASRALRCLLLGKENKVDSASSTCVAEAELRSPASSGTPAAGRRRLEVEERSPPVVEARKTNGKTIRKALNANGKPMENHQKATAGALCGARQWAAPVGMWD